MHYSEHAEEVRKTLQALIPQSLKEIKLTLKDLEKRLEKGKKIILYETREDKEELMKYWNILYEVYERLAVAYEFLTLEDYTLMGFE